MKSESEMWGFYIHIPFCERRCGYCDFFSTAGYSKAEMRRYCGYLQGEIKLFAEKNKEEIIVQSLYIGGGTPSYAPPESVIPLIKTIKNLFPVTGDAEITIEVNPKSALEKTLIDYRNAGVNRLSIGIQSLNQDDLKTLGRLHSIEDGYKTVNSALTVGFNNINVDVIFGIPGQTLKSLESTVEEIIEFAPEHISAYALTVEPGTPLSGMVQSGELFLPDDEAIAEMFILIRQNLQNSGYEQYEISNYARPGHRSLHNMQYWRRGRYKGFGLSAHSFDGNVRSWNTTDFQWYYAEIDAGKLPIKDSEVLTTLQQMNEEIMLRLRTNEGLSLEEFKRQFGNVYTEKLKQNIDNFIHNGGFEYIELNSDSIVLNNKGFLVSDKIIETLLLE